jgi:hypothetical protein
LQINCHDIEVPSIGVRLVLTAVRIHALSALPNYSTQNVSDFASRYGGTTTEPYARIVNVMLGGKRWAEARVPE